MNEIQNITAVVHIRGEKTSQELPRAEKLKLKKVFTILKLRENQSNMEELWKVRAVLKTPV